MIETILLKRWFRSDTIWAQPWAYKSMIAYIPLFLDTWALLSSQYWRRERIERFQAERLRSLILDARRLPYWRDILPEHLEGQTPDQLMRHVPVTRKLDINRRSRDEIVDERLLSRSDRDNTSGSTGKPLHFFHDWGASLRSFGVTERIFRTTGTRYPVIYMRARARNGFTFYKHI